MKGFFPTMWVLDYYHGMIVESLYMESALIPNQEDLDLSIAPTEDLVSSKYALGQASILNYPLKEQE